MLKKLATVGLMADAGCHMALLQALLPVLGSFQIVHCYLLMDSKTMPEDVDIIVVEGGVRTKHDEDQVKLARKRQHYATSLRLRKRWSMYAVRVPHKLVEGG